MKYVKWITLFILTGIVLNFLQELFFKDNTLEYIIFLLILGVIVFFLTQMRIKHKK